MEANEQAEYAELQTHLAVHVQALHEDAEGQAQLAFRAGELAAELKARAKRAKMAAEAVEAKVDQAVRADPESYGLSKTTETSIRSAVVGSDPVLESREAQIAAEKGADLASALSNAFEHRRSMLRIEAELYVNNYWGDVEVREHGMRRTATEARGKAAEEKLEAVEERRAERKRRRAEEG